MNPPMILLTARDIREAIVAVEPWRIAVAYVGDGWRDYLPPGKLEELVVSPTLGSNPRAIKEIMADLGDSNVHFLDELHAKVYLGKGAAVVGSCNLSKNGMGDFGRQEAAVRLDQPDAVQDLNKEFERYKTLANKQYPTPKDKEEKLRHLWGQWNKAIWHGLETDDSKEPLLLDYTAGLEQIHIAGYSGGTLPLKEDTIGEAIPECRETRPEYYFSSHMPFLEADDIERGDWILYWRANQDGRPRSKGCVGWMRAHHVIPGGARDKPYTKLVGEARSLTPGRPPFRLGNATKEIIRNALASDQFAGLRCGSEDNWSLKTADEILPQFLKHVREAQQQYLAENPGEERNL